jgi:hypothetical protein
MVLALALGQGWSAMRRRLGGNRPGLAWFLRRDRLGEDAAAPRSPDAGWRRVTLCVK